MGSAIKVVIVEPDRAACVFASAKAGVLTSVPSDEATIMAMLECFTPSLIAWATLEKVADAFMTVSEEAAMDAMRRLANRNTSSVIAGESGAAGLAGLFVVCGDEAAKQELGLGPDSHVLVINTETATDPASFEAIVGRHPDQIRTATSGGQRLAGAGHPQIRTEIST
jgi:diaminopropionate ammonia-lyase